MTHAELDPIDLGGAPPDLLAMWIRAVRRMDRDMLDTFVRRTWRAWSAVSLRPLAIVVDARRAELDGE